MGHSFHSLGNYYSKFCLPLERNMLVHSARAETLSVRRFITLGSLLVQTLGASGPAIVPSHLRRYLFGVTP